MEIEASVELKTIALFSRLRLSELFVLLANNLEARFNIIHIAFSNEEELFIRENDKNSVIVNFSKIFEEKRAAIKHVDKALLDSELAGISDNDANLNSIINADRTMSGLSHEDCVVTIKSYLDTWKHIITNYQFDILLHEPVTLAMTEIGYYVTRSNSLIYLALIQSYGIKEYNFILVDAHNGSIFTEGKARRINHEVVDSFLCRYQSDANELYSQYSSLIPVKRKKWVNISKVLVRLIARKAKNLVRNTLASSKDLGIIELYHLRNDLLVNKIRDTLYYYDVENYQLCDFSENYYYYPLHMEPEATVLYWGSNKYTGQVKLIENIAMQLPYGSCLYVKDHPHAGAYRKREDYIYLKSIPNVKLINPSVKGNIIIQNAKGVITICGTSGFESLLYKVPVYLLGNTFYKEYPGVYYMDSIFELKELLKSHLDTKVKIDPVQVAERFLPWVLDGFTDYFLDFPEKSAINHDVNAKRVSNEIARFLNIA